MTVAVDFNENKNAGVDGNYGSVLQIPVAAMITGIMWKWLC